MRIDGTIWPVGDNPRLTREAWCEFIDRRPELRRRPPVEKPNPFARGETVTLRPKPDFANVVIDEQIVGWVEWSQTEDAFVEVNIEPAALSLAHEWAYELGGRFELNKRCRFIFLSAFARRIIAAGASGRGVAREDPRDEVNPRDEFESPFETRGRASRTRAPQLLLWMGEVDCFESSGGVHSAAITVELTHRSPGVK